MPYKPTSPTSRPNTLWTTNIAHLERSKSRNPEQGRSSSRVRADPTGDQAVSMEVAIREVRRFEKALYYATLSYWNRLLPVHGCLRRAQKAIDRTYEPTDQRLAPSKVDPGEFNDAKEAKKRREDRGEGWGTG